MGAKTDKYECELEWYLTDSNRLIKASKIEGCKLVEKRELPFDFKDGACNTFLEPTPRILLCFADEGYGNDDSKRCHM